MHLSGGELLQAFARVNRTGHGKEAGIVVDCFGVARHLTEALAAYSAEDVEGALRSLADEIPKLRDRHQRVFDLPVLPPRIVDYSDRPRARPPARAAPHPRVSTPSLHKNKRWTSFLP